MGGKQEEIELEGGVMMGAKREREGERDLVCVLMTLKMEDM